MSKWTSIILTALVLVASAGVAWGVMSTRVSAAEAVGAQHEEWLRRHDVELKAIREEQKDSQWNLWALCRHVGAPDCRRPGDR